MPQETKSGKPTARRYTDTEKSQAVGLVRQLSDELKTDHGTVKRIADQLGYSPVWVGRAPGPTRSAGRRYLSGTQT